MNLVVSPHLDDAVLGAGQWIATHPGTVVLTVFAGMPHRASQSTDWDRRCGFLDAAEAIATRRAEDRAALAVLQAEPLWLEYVDDQYDEPCQTDVLIDTLRRALVRLAPLQVLIPLGLFHSDHVLTQRACVRAAQMEGLTALGAYEEAIYRAIPGCLQEALARLSRQGLLATPAPEQPCGGKDAKADALAAYVSQRRTIGPARWADASRPERRWDLAWKEEASLSSF